MNFKYLIRRGLGITALIELGIVLLSFTSVLIRSEFLSTVILLFSLMILFFIIKRDGSTNIYSKITLIILTLPFTIALLGLLYTDRPFKAVELLFRLSPLLFVPLIYARLNPDKAVTAYLFLFKYFPWLTILVFLLYIIIGAIYTVNGYGNYLYYSNFSSIAGIHPTYLGLIINLSLWFVIKRKLSINKIIYYGLFLCFFIFQLIVASKISLFICVSLILFDCIFSFKGVFKRVIAAISIVVVSLVVAKPFIENRFLTEKIDYDTGLSNKEIILNFYKNDVSSRIVLWKANIESLTSSEWIYGKGTAASEEPRKIIYKRYKLDNAYDESYNAHNQYVETLYSYGLVGLIFFLLHCITLVYLAFKAKELHLVGAGTVYFIFLLYFMTESILQRSIGIVLYGFIIVYVIICYTHSYKKNE